MCTLSFYLYGLVRSTQYYLRRSEGSNSIVLVRGEGVDCRFWKVLTEDGVKNPRGGRRDEGVLVNEDKTTYECQGVCGSRHGSLNR